jgi:hypothetical protein
LNRTLDDDSSSILTFQEALGETLSAKFATLAKIFSMKGRFKLPRRSQSGVVGRRNGVQDFHIPL